MRMSAAASGRGKKGDVVSIQAGFLAPVEKWFAGDLANSLPESVPEAHLRALYGRGWQWELGNSFVSAEAGYHWRGEREADEMRLDVTLGHERWKGLLGLLGVYTTVPVTRRGEASLKLSPSIAYTLWPRLGPNDKKPYGELHPSTVQLGVTWDVLNPGDGLGVAVSVWRSF